MFAVFLAHSIYNHLEENTAFATGFILSITIDWSGIEIWPLVGKAAYSLALSLFNAFVVHKIKTWKGRKKTDNNDTPKSNSI
jgi:hypothetical protein